MRWPRGKYNGRRIEGFRVHFTLHLLDWYFKPLLHWNHGEPRFSGDLAAARAAMEWAERQMKKRAIKKSIRAKRRQKA